MICRSSRRKRQTEKDSVSKRPAYDPFRGLHNVTLRELLEDVFSDSREIVTDKNDDIFSGPNALNVNSQVLGQGGDRPLHCIVRSGNAQCVGLLLQAGADPNAKGEMEVTPLYWAVGDGNLEVARLLLEAGARIDVINELGFSNLGLCSPDGPVANPTMFRLLKSFWPGVLPRDAKSRRA
jgi:ankyrin repeat protein